MKTPQIWKSVWLETSHTALYPLSSSWKFYFKFTLNWGFPVHGHNFMQKLLVQNTSYRKILYTVLALYIYMYAKKMYTHWVYILLQNSVMQVLVGDHNGIVSNKIYDTIQYTTHAAMSLLY